MEKGWDATDLLRPLWRGYPGGRDALAGAVGTSPSVLSAINRGRRNLGMDLGTRLADELGVSLLELGAPEAHADEHGLTLVDRLRALGEQVSFLMKSREVLTKDLADARTRLARLERGETPTSVQAKPRPGTSV